MRNLRLLRDFQRDPWSSLFDANSEISKWLSESTTSARFHPTVDIEEKDNHLLFSFDLPGVDKENIDLQIENGVLTVTGERNSESTDKDAEGSFYHRERTYGRFQRSFTLPTTVDADQVEAHFENGVLRLAVPKKEQARSKKIKIGEGRPSLLKKIVGGKDA